jgi:hypothetical protein
MKSKILQAALIAATMVGVAAPAFADDWRDHERHEWRERAREREWREHHRGVVYQPGYVYAAPPPVVYAPPPPPPVYAGPSFSLTIPLR